MVHIFGYAEDDDDEGELKLKVDIPPYRHREAVQDRRDQCSGSSTSVV